MLSLLFVTLTWSEEPQSLYRVLQDGKWGAISADGTVVVDPEYDYLFPFVNGMTVVRTGDFQEGKRAYLDSEGNLITGFDFDRAYHFFGLLAVVNRDGKEGYIDRDGRPVTDISFDYAADFRGDYAIVSAGSRSSRKWGAVDSKGKLTLPVEYESLSHSPNPQIMVFRQGAKYGLVSVDGEVISPPSYDSLYSYQGYLFAAKKIDNVANYSILSGDGAIVYQPSEKNAQIRSVSAGFATVYFAGKYGLVDLDDKRQLDTDFSYLGIASDRFVITGVGSGRNRRYGVIDPYGREIAPPKYYWISQFNEQNVAIVKEETLYGCINEYGRVVVEPVFEGVRGFVDGYAAVRKDGKWGYIDSSGNLVIECEFDWVYDFSEGFAVFRVGDQKGGKRGYIDTNGDVVIKPQFDWAYSFDNGIAHVAFGEFFDGEFGYIDTAGSYVWEPTN